jgi:DNA mismatch repair protein MutL
MEKKIQVLNPHVAERIAAGEVIERPASVVKELVENSLDAGATEVLVILEEGGKSLIEIVDNGHGMPPEDLALCIERHATSKLNSLDDLEKIRTLGFRGEALPSIAAVSDLSMISRARGLDTAYELNTSEIAGRLEQKPTPKKVTVGHFINSPHGTRIQARGIFSQIPARLKFLKSQSAEVSHVREWIERLALAYPHVGFQLMSDDRSILNLRPQDEKSRVQTILADGDDYPVISVSNDQDGFRDNGLQVRIHWLQGLSSPNSKKLVQVVNSRAVRDRVLQQALLMPFRQALLPGQFPAVALFVQINPAALDVNVHPTKTEVRFLDSRKVFQTIESLAKSMLIREGSPAVVPSFQSPKFETQWDSPSTHFTKTSGWESATPAASFSTNSSASSAPPPSSWSFSESVAQPISLWKERELVPSEVPARVDSTSSANPLQYAKYTGILFNTYLVYERGNEMVLVDQHAAHERIRYETLKKRTLHTLQSETASFSSQSLLIPETVRFQAESRHSLEGKLPWFSRFGFEVETFGEDTLLFRAVPAEWGTKQLKPRLKNLVDRILTLESVENSVLLDEALFEALASEACHSAIRAGDHLEPEEAKHLVHQLFQCEHPWNCPHGRPTVVIVPESKLEEWFQRKV